MSDWKPIHEHDSDSMAYLVTAKNRYGAWREPISAFMDAAGVWRVLGSRGGMTPLSFAPTMFTHLPSPTASINNPKG